MEPIIEKFLREKADVLKDWHRLTLYSILEAFLDWYELERQQWALKANTLPSDLRGGHHEG